MCDIESRIQTKNQLLKAGVDAEPSSLKVGVALTKPPVPDEMAVKMIKSLINAKNQLLKGEDPEPSSLNFVSAPVVPPEMRTQHLLYGWRVDAAELVKHLRATYGSGLQFLPGVEESSADDIALFDSSYAASFDEDESLSSRSSSQSDQEDDVDVAKTLLSYAASFDEEESLSSRSSSQSDQEDDVDAAKTLLSDVAIEDEHSDSEYDLEELVLILAEDVHVGLSDHLHILDNIIWVTRNYLSVDGDCYEGALWRIPELSILAKFAAKAKLQAPDWLLRQS